MKLLHKLNRIFKIIIYGKCEKCGEPFEEIPNTGLAKCKCGREIPTI